MYVLFIWIDDILAVAPHAVEVYNVSRVHCPHSTVIGLVHSGGVIESFNHKPKILKCGRSHGHGQKLKVVICS